MAVSPGVHEVDGDLRIDGYACAELAARFGTPLLVYSGARLTANAAAVAEAFGSTCEAPRVFFPVKACYLGAVLTALVRCGVGAEVGSELELLLALRAGFRPAQILFNGPGKTDRELGLALDAGVRAIHVESVEELAALSDMAGLRGITAPVGVRVHIPLGDPSWQFAGTGGKFGADAPSGDARHLLTRALAQPHVRVTGLHVHNYAWQTSARLHLEALAGLRQLACECDWVPHYLDLGGGFATRRGLAAAGTDLRSLGSRLTAAARPPGSPALWLEPGRLIVGDAASVLTRIVRTKRNSGQRWLLTDAASNLLVPGPFSRYECQSVRGLPGSLVTTAVGDGLCLPQGVLSPGAELPEALQTGDLLCVRDAGAYTLHLGSGFGYPQPAVLWMDGDGPRLLRHSVSPAAASEAWF